MPREQPIHCKLIVEILDAIRLFDYNFDIYPKVDTFLILFAIFFVFKLIIRYIKKEILKKENRYIGAAYLEIQFLKLSPIIFSPEY